jgi:hemerythrin-like domain-containing protein
MDAITLLRNDHKTVEQLFKRFEKAGDRAYVQKREIVDRIIEELSVHAAIEELVFYPVARATVPDTEDIALESLEEHHIVKWLLSELVDLDPRDERFDAKVTVLMENVRHHVEEEQSDFFPKVRRELSRTELVDLGQALADAKKTAPTHPHPRSPDVPPANAVVGAIAGVVDRVGDNIGGLAQGGVTAVQDLIARILRNDKPKVSPTGTTAARTQAKNVRNGASAAVDGVEQTARSVKSGASKTARTAVSGAKGTATSAKKSARTTASTAKRAATTTRHTARAATRRTTTTAKRAASRTAASAKGSK